VLSFFFTYKKSVFKYFTLVVGKWQVNPLKRLKPRNFGTTALLALAKKLASEDN
jgi:hypothetical protein